MTPGKKLQFADLRQANLARLPQFRDRQGRLSHSKPDGSDWSLSDWLQAVTGELGELANLLKKVRRGDFSLDEARADVADEIADVIIYLDILAMQCGVELGAAVQRKFNIVSRRVGANVFLSGGEENA